MKKFLITPILLIFFCSITSYAQLPVSLQLPRSSPKESRSITIGYTTISLEYSSVGIKDREIWGGLVPYDRVWRTGANENTLFTVTDDVLINGEPLEAGSYGMHTIPGEEEWIVIFSNFSEAWGSFFYDESEDALRITVPAEEMDSKYEWMKFSFSDYTSTSVEVSLKWAHRKIPFLVEVPIETTFAHIEKQFRNLPGFSWQGWVQGATYTLNNNHRTDLGLEWAERAAQRERSVQTVGLLGKLYIVNGNPEKGLEAAEELTSTWSENWRSHYSAAEIFEEAGDIEQAKSAYLKAAEMADERSARVLRQRAEDLEE